VVVAVLASTADVVVTGGVVAVADSVANLVIPKLSKS